MKNNFDFSHDNTQDTEKNNSESPQYQSTLIKQWRTNLMCLKKDVGFDITHEQDLENKQFAHVFKAMEYLDKKNTLLDENEDFQFSDAGFLAYKMNHMLVFDYLSQLTVSSAPISRSRFYITSRVKQIKQQLKPTAWLHSIVHFIFLFIVTLVLGLISFLAIVKTQDNLFVKLLLAWFCFVNLSTAKQLIGKYRKLAATPFRFSLSLLGIHSVNVFLKVIVFCVIPFLIINKNNPYLGDDFIIIGLFIVCIFNYRVADESRENIIPKDLSKVESPNV